IIEERMINRLKLHWKSSIKHLLPWFIPFLLVISWQIFSRLGAIPERILPAPTEVVKSAIQLSATGELVNHVSVSLGRACIGFVLVGEFGFIYGLLIGGYRLSLLLFDTLNQFLLSI